MAVSSTLVTFVIFGVVAVVGWLIYILAFKKDDELKGDIVVNLASYESHGRALGVLKKMQRGAGGRFKIWFSPRDVDTEKLAKAKMVLADEDIIVQPHKLISIPSGAFSEDRNFHFILPDNAEELPEEFKKTPIGIMITQYVEAQDFVKKRIEILKQTITDKDAILKEIGSGEMTEPLLNMTKGWVNDLAAMMLDAKEAKRKADSPVAFQPQQPHA